MYFSKLTSTSYLFLWHHWRHCIQTILPCGNRYVPCGLVNYWPCFKMEAFDWLLGATHSTPNWRLYSSYMNIMILIVSHNINKTNFSFTVTLHNLSINYVELTSRISTNLNWLPLHRTPTYICCFFFTINILF